MSRSPPRRLVSKTELRRRFNEGGYWRRALAGEFDIDVVYNRPAHPRSGQPPGTMSQRLHYYTKSGQLLAIVHQFQLPGGALGASKRPDPKQLLEDDVVYYIREKRPKRRR